MSKAPTKETANSAKNSQAAKSEQKSANPSSLNGKPLYDKDLMDEVDTWLLDNGVSAAELKDSNGRVARYHTFANATASTGLGNLAGGMTTSEKELSSLYSSVGIDTAEERSFWDTIPHEDPLEAVELEISIGISFELPKIFGKEIGRFDFGYAASIAFDNRGEVSFAPSALEFGTGMSKPDWSVDTAFSVLEAPGLSAEGIAYGEVITGGPSFDLWELGRIKIGEKKPSVYLTLDYELGAALTDDGARPVRGFEFGGEISQGGGRIDLLNITYQNSQNLYGDNTPITSNWGMPGQVLWAWYSGVAKSANKVLYSGMDNAPQYLTDLNKRLNAK
ncbi:hypothetical protein C2869_22295 (plasmid) [Saccharobesus litoralis]|uniref:Uncharacterized protein n=1 Tax=Saccharobesus litoralis TaxID=2172099 RepID=A0A2S0VYG1_9ALTE|nr:hypothetical protein [Saccharobesus litoralis]AWB69233.1 hypothetical protein C2869_22295 [Saccharobesus litoralis]